MQELLQFIQRLTWQDIAAAVGVLFGVISLIAYIEQRRSARATDAVAEFARRHVAKDISEEELKKLAEQRVALNEEVTQHIPVLARQAVLREQLELHERAVAEHFVAWREITNELQQSQTQSKLDPLLRDTILDRILPRFEQQRALENVRNRITALSVAIALTGTLLPDPLSSLVAFALAFPLASALLKFLRHQGDAAKFAEFIRTSGQVAYGVAVAILAYMTILFTIFGPTEEWAKHTRLGAAIVTCLAALAFWPYRRWLFRNAEKLGARIYSVTA